MKLALNPFIIALGILGTFIWGQFVLHEDNFRLVLLGAMLIIFLISILIRPVFSFSILMSFILAIGFLNVALGWNKHLGISGQGMNIQIQTIFTLGAIFSWFCGYSIKNNNSLIHQLQDEVKRLQKVEDHTGMLTFNEFITHSQLLFNGLKRRGEDGFLVKIQYDSEDAPYKTRVVSEKMSKIILNSLRKEYDLACHLNKNSVLVFLNNTNETGLEIVLDRIYNNMKLEQKLNTKELSIQKQPILDNWDNTFSFIHSWRSEEI